MPSRPEGRADRRYKAKAKRDQRDDFQRDRDRIRYSTALRRLAGVTQVVAAAEGHVFHNRLTHTLEVAQLARRLAQMLGTDKELAGAVGGVEAEVAEAAALAHDLGHPPFGHVAEDVIDRLVVERLGIADGFEGNAQTFRVITKLSVRYVEHPGQDLTAATLNAVLKYPWFRGATEFKQKKFGAYRTEQDDYDWARGVQPPAALDEKSAEAEIMDWADDIAYAVHDMEDFYRAGFIPLDRLLADPPGGETIPEEADRFLEGTFTRWQSDFRPIRDHTDDQLREAFANVLEFLREAQQISAPYSGSLEQRANLRGLTSELITRYVSAIELHPPEKGNQRLVAIRPEADREIAMLKQLTWFYVIHGPSLAAQQHGQRRVVRELFDIFFEAGASNRYMLPPAPWELFQSEVNEGRYPEETLRARMAADVVCSLSEQQAIAVHQRLTGVDPGSVLTGFI